jgi:probable HAF family extracellular repeat protein
MASTRRLVFKNRSFGDFFGAKRAEKTNFWTETIKLPNNLGHLELSAGNCARGTDIMKKTGLLLILWLVAWGATTADAVRYTVTNLGTLPGRYYSNATAINNRGQVVGSSYSGSQSENAFIWDKGVMTDLGKLPGASNSLPSSLNDAAQVVGRCHFADPGVNQGFLWEKGVMTNLGTLPGGDSTEATGINLLGQVVGSSYHASGDGRAFRWDQGSGMMDLGTLTGKDWSSAMSINDAGQIVGWSQTSIGRQHAFLWQGTMMELGTLPPGYRESFAYAINNATQVVGYFITDTWGFHAFFCEGGSYRDLGTLGGALSCAYAINDSGQVVGDAYNSQGKSRAFIWQNGVMTDLNTLIVPTSDVWELIGARGINNAGQIVCFGKYNYLDRGILLTPIAHFETATILLLLED